ncbi:MAG TPA: hypothetical protein GXZ74_02620 [Tissierellia bacterium]|nr:hypothetical protein [Tissierellia bacterium]
MKAVIDIGSNSVRLLVFDGEADFKQGVSDLEITRLGQGLDRTGRLSPEGIRATWEVLDRFQQTIEQTGVDEVEAFATEAVRTAADGADFIEQLRRRYGWKARIISGEEEALIGFVGATSALAEGEWTLIDIGGASTEIIQGRDAIDYRQSFPIGALRYTERPETDLAKVFQDLPPLFGQIVGIGGTITTIMAMELALTSYRRDRIQGAKLTKACLEKWVNRLQAMTPQARRQLPGLDPKREPIILGGMKLLHYLLERFDQEWLVVSDYGNLEGYAISRGLCRTNSI